MADNTSLLKSISKQDRNEIENLLDFRKRWVEAGKPSQKNPEKITNFSVDKPTKNVI